MAEREDCINGIAKKTGRSRKQVEDDLQELLDRADAAQAAGKPRRAALAKAGEDMLDEIGEIAAVYKRAAQIDALTRTKNFHWIDARMGEGHDGATVLTAKMAGVATPFDRSSKSAEATNGAMKRKYAGGLDIDLERARLDRLFASRAIEKDVTDELAELNKDDRGKPGQTKNPQALEIAKLIRKWQKVSMQDTNDAGGWVRSYSGYITRTEHDADLIRTGGRSAKATLKPDDARQHWIDSVKKNADLARTFGSLDPDEILPEMWTKMARGDHYEINPMEDVETNYSNVAARASAHREIHFKDAAAWRNYTAEFSFRNPTQAIMQGFDSAARRVALLQHFGTRPREEFEKMIGHVKTRLKNDPEKYRAFEQKEASLRNLYNQLDTSANKPANAMWSRTVAGAMALQRWSKLHHTVFTHLASIPTKSFAGRYVGLSFTERFGNVLSGLFRGGDGSEKRQAAQILMAGAENRIGHMVSSYDVADQAAGTMSKIDAKYFKYSGLHAAVDNQREDFENMVARHLGMQRGVAFADLHYKDQRLLKTFGLGEAEWKALHTGDWTNINGNTYLMPPDARNLSDDAIRGMIRDRGGIGSRGPFTDEIIRKTREDLADTLHALYWEQGRQAIFAPSARGRAILFQGTQQHSPNLYKAMQLLMQFKVWPAEMVLRTWARMVNGGDGNMEKVGAAVELVVASAVFGVLAEALREVTMGQDPRARMAAAPAAYVGRGLLRSGAGTIGADYLFGEFDRHGRSILGAIAGPTYGQAENLINLRNEFMDALTKGKWAALGAGAAHEVKQNIPFVDIWWTFKAFDYLVTYRLLDWLNPGYLRRYEQKQKRERGIDYWMRPSAVA